MTSTRSRVSRWTRALLVLVGLLVCVGAGGAVAFYWVFLRDLPDMHGVADYRPPLATIVVDREGRPIGEFYNQRRRLVGFDEIPKLVVDAFVSAEDSSFFEHQGIDYQGILRAAWVNLLAGGEIKQGGSTITQQMVKSLLLSPERSYTRKVREMILARRIEQRFTKQEILYLYLNQIYFGHGAYGVGEAARTYFGKTVSQLSVSEAAQLAGLPKAPTRYSPLRNPEAGERRRLYVLGRMRDDGVLDASRYQRAVAAPPKFADGSRVDDFAAAAYFTEEVRRFLFEKLGGQAVLEGGLRIETTLDLELQRAAVAAVQRGLEALDRRHGYRGPLRRVAPGEIDAEIARVAEENRFVQSRPVPAEEATHEEAPRTEEPLETPEPAISADALESALEAAQEPLRLLGVVTAVDRDANLAQVALGPGLRGVVEIDDASWARPMDADTAPHAETSIERIFRVGDIARFEVLRPAAESAEADEGAEKHDDAEKGARRLALFQEPKVEGALLSIEVGSGHVLALVGGYDFARSQFDRAIQARRQPGSAFKPLVYGTALSRVDAAGRPLYTPASIVHDRPKVYTDQSSGIVWKPKNYGRSFYGPITLRTALAKSVNNATVHICDEVGVDAVLAYARRLGIRSPLERSLALALGTSGVTLLELTRSYAVFPNGGRSVVPTFLRRVVDGEGKVLLENEPLGDPPIETQAPVATRREEPRPFNFAANDDEESDATAAAFADPKQVLPPEQAYLMADMLRAVVIEGTGQRARALERPVGGKTGTTNDQADAWFVGFSPEIATGVWVGFDEIRFLGTGETGARAALPIWTDYMRTALAERPNRDFEVPGDSAIVWARIDRETGLLASHQSKKTVFQPFIAGSEPTRTTDAAREDDQARQDLREDSLPADSARQMQLDSY